MLKLTPATGAALGAAIVLTVAALWHVTHAHGHAHPGHGPHRVAAIDMPPPDSPAGGDFTTRLNNRNAFAQSGPKISLKERRDFFFGNRLFNTNWTIAPGSVEAFDGLGPMFNRVSCSGCHVRDGRGRPPLADETALDSMLVRISLPGQGAHGGPNAHPVYGDQISDRAIPGVEPEARIHIHWEKQPGKFADGTRYELKKPVISFSDEKYGPLGDDLLVSPRVASAVFGLGLLEAVPADMILARADPEDANGDGISGRPNYVFDPATGKPELGRFGWKANQPSLRKQDADAAFGDMGLTSSPHPVENCSTPQTDCAASFSSKESDLSDAFLDKLVLYTRTLAVPARRHAGDKKVRQGAHLFAELGCAACHTPTLKTGPEAAVPVLANQTFHPYTDLLLHDMGPGLADGRPDFEATGTEWRTPPLWGLGLVPVVNGHNRYLHDGRAEGLEEAILWHGGEAEATRQRYVELDRHDREALIAFLNSL
ncbi:MAG: c-type cytochrome [Rhizobiales bacterium]|nr:c-type cytochrome [Hyphomicrobiales bacterium]